MISNGQTKSVDGANVCRDVDAPARSDIPCWPLLIIIREAGRGLLLLEEMKARPCLFLSISTWNLSSGTSFRRHAFQSIFSYLGVGEGLETW